MAEKLARWRVGKIRYNRHRNVTNIERKLFLVYPRWHHCLLKNHSPLVERRTYQIRAHIHTYAHTHTHKHTRACVCIVHKRGHRSRFCLLRRSNVAPTNCSRTVPRDMNFLATLWLHLPYSFCFSFASDVSLSIVVSNDLFSRRLYPRDNYRLYMLGGSTQ